jgi:serine/threonine protein kinase
VPENHYDEATSKSLERSAISSGPDTTGGSHSAQGAPNAGPAPSHEIVANAGIDRFGRAVFLAQEPLPNDAATRISPRPLIALYAQTPHVSVPDLMALRSIDRTAIQRQPECYVCATPRIADARFCEACGATLTIAVEGPAAASPYAFLQSKDATQGAPAVFGEMAATDGAIVYFAHDQGTGRPVVALVPRMASATGAGRSVLDVMPAMVAIQPSLPAPPKAATPLPRLPSFATPSAQSIAVGEDPLVGTLIDGKYRILRRLGQGGMGVVYDARHEELRVRRAIKVMHASLQARADLITRFYEEARNAARIKHQHVCTVHDFGSANGLIYIAMEFVEGEPLSALLRREGKLPSSRASTIVAQTADALEAAHALKIVHRDVKPDNIMLCRHEDGRDDVKVVDFGISKALNRSELTGGGTDTQLGVVIGTLDYMSDEQRSGGEVDSRTDVYALGRTAVRMLFGELPEHSDWARWSGLHVNPDLGAVLTRAFAPRDLRYGSAGELSRDLANALRGGPPGSDLTWLDRTRRWSHSVVTSRRVQIGAAAVAGLAVIGAVVVALARRPQPLPATNTISLAASPAMVKFEAAGDSTTPSTQEVQITSGASNDTATLSVGGVQYDSSAANWLAPATWRDGKATVPAVLVLTPISGVKPGVHTARVSITAPSAITPVIVTATLAVRVPDSPPPAGRAGDPCARPRQQLADIRKLTDPLTGTAADARRVLAMVPPLVASLCSPGEKVEAQLRLAEAHMTLQQTSRACEVLRSIEADARKSSFAENVRVLLTNCP